MSATYPDPNLSTAAREWSKLANRHWAEKARAAAEHVLALLPDPSLPTLEDMDEDARHALIGKDVKVEGWNKPSMLIAVHKDEGAVLGRNWINPRPWVEVRPLSELTPVDAAPDQQVNSSESPKSSLPRPEDVPEREPWSVRYYGKEWVGVRSGRAREPWSIISMDGLYYRDVDDPSITLISRLVPKTH